MKWNHRWSGAVALASALVSLAGGSAEAQYYQGGYWGGGSGGQTVAGDTARGAGMYALGAGQYNLDTSRARSINANTAMQWNQYMYNSRIEAARVYGNRLARKEQRGKADYNAIQARVRLAPNSLDIANGNALNAAADELNDPKVFPKAISIASKMKVGGDAIRDIPFQYAAAAISMSVHQLTQGEPPACLKSDEFGPDREKLKAIATELRQEGEELGAHKPETIQKAKDQIMATRAKVEATFPQNSQARRDAEKYVKALSGLASMLETPAINVLLAGVDKRPEATLGDLMEFMSAYNLRFGATETPRQREVYLAIYPMLAQIRTEVLPGLGSGPSTTPGVQDAPGAVFDTLGYNPSEGKAPQPLSPQ